MVMRLGAIGCALGVALGAFGAHTIEQHISETAMGWWETATQYLWYHAIAMVAVGAFQARPKSVDRAVLIFILPGIILFSGSLFLYAFTSFRTFGMITPVGGVLLLIGWLRLAFALRKQKSGAL